MIYKLYKTTYLDKHDKCYKNIITINKNPNDASLNSQLKQVSRQKLSLSNFGQRLSSLDKKLQAPRQIFGHRV